MATDPKLLERVQALEARLAVLEAVEEIRRLKSNYAALVDDRYVRGAPRAPDELVDRARRIADLFTEDAVWDGGPALGVCRGRAELEKRMAKPTLLFSWHYFVKPYIEVDGDLLEFIPGHGCTTVNLHDHLYAVRDGRLEAIWEIAGRGRVR